MLLRVCDGGGFSGGQTSLFDLLQSCGQAIADLQQPALWRHRPAEARAAACACARGVDAAALALAARLDTVLTRLLLGEDASDDDDGVQVLLLPAVADGASGTAVYASAAAAALRLRQAAAPPLQAAETALDAHVDFWLERADLVERGGVQLGRAVDLWEGGPTDWLDLALIQPARALWLGLRGSTGSAAVTQPSSASEAAVAAAVATSGSASPREKARRLAALRMALAHLLGATRRLVADEAALCGGAFCADSGELPPPCAERRLLPFLAAVLCPGGRTFPGSSADLPSEALASEPLVQELLEPAAAAAVVRLEHAVTTLSSAALALPALAARVRSRSYPLAARSAWQRHWLRHGVAAAAAAGGLYLVAWRGDDVRAWARTAATSMTAFYAEHVAAPLREMAAELLSGRRGAMADPAALDDARASLRTMLLAFAAKLAASPARLASLSPDVRAVAAEQARSMLAGSDVAACSAASAAAALDMRPVSERFVAEVERPLANAVSGDLVQLMLIQIAFIKKEVLAAMAAMDAILADNKFNLQMSAMLPALVVVYGSGVALTSLAASIRAPIDTASAEMRVRMLLRDAHRLLLQAEPAGALAASTETATATSDYIAALWSDEAWLQLASAVEETFTGAVVGPVGLLGPTSRDDNAIRTWQHCGFRPALLAIGSALCQRFASVGAFVFRARSAETRRISDTGVPKRLSASTLPVRSSAPCDSTFLPALAADHIGRLLLIQEQLRALTVGLRSSIVFAEWTRLQQDLDDLGAAHTSLEARIKTVERLLQNRRWR